MIKIRVSPSVSSFQVDFPNVYTFKNAKKEKELKRSTKDRGSINFRTGVVKIITDDEWEYLKEKYERLIGSSLVLLGEIKEETPTAKPKKEERTAFFDTTGGDKEKYSKKKNK